MPLYAAAVLIGAARYIEATFAVNYDVALALFSILIAAYVIAGGIKGVMYTDALQGTLMFIGMLLLIVYTYSTFGGINAAHRKLDQLPADIQTASQELLPIVREAVPNDVPDDQAVDWFIGKASALKAATETMNDDEKKAFVGENPEYLPLAKLLKGNPALGKDSRFVNRAGHPRHRKSPAGRGGPACPSSAPISGMCW